MDNQLRFRQVHLDFHTSPHIKDVGNNFDPENFADRLSRAKVDSVTCFARCHHGLLYYDSQTNPERIHPNLASPDLLLEQIKACHARGIRVPIYTTIQWDAFSAQEHPEWLCVNEDGKQYDTEPLQAGFYRYLDILHPGFRQFLKEHIGELFRMMPVDGLFLDIVQPHYSLAPHWLKAMNDAAFDIRDPESRQQFAQLVIDEWKLEMSEFIRSQPGYSEDCTIFYNQGHIGPAIRMSKTAYTHFELESLPSGGWGYLHFPITARYARTQDIDCMGMTGKFHTSWGDFHSFKNPAALDFECFQMLALNAKCSIGDQLLPDGSLCEHTYELIGTIYHQVAEKQAWCEKAVPVAEIGVLTPEVFYHDQSRQTSDFSAIMGATRMLQEGKYQFDILDDTADFQAYKLIILPDNIPITGKLHQSLKEFLSHGGKLIASFASGMDEDKTHFVMDELGVSLSGEAVLDDWGNPVRGYPYPKNDYTDYLLPGPGFDDGLKQTEYVMYRRGMDIVAAGNAAVLADRIGAYFDRTYRHYCSHMQTPSKGQSLGPGIVQNDQVIYFAHPIFSTYNDRAPIWCRTFFFNALKRLLPDPLVQVDGPSGLLATLNKQPSKNRLVLHLLYYVPERRATEFDVIEDIIPLHDLSVRLAIHDNVENIATAPQGQKIPFEKKEGQVSFTLPRLDGHQMIEIKLNG